MPPKLLGCADIWGQECEAVRERALLRAELAAATALRERLAKALRALVENPSDGVRFTALTLLAEVE